MSKVITFSRVFPKYHPKAGQPTYFVEKIWKYLYDAEKSIYNPLGDFQQSYDNIFNPNGIGITNIHQYTPKLHTIRNGNRWKVGDKFSPRVWSGKPYISKQIIIAPDIEIKKIFDFSKDLISDKWYVNGVEMSSAERIDLAINDGLNYKDLLDWFPKPFNGQIICWSDTPQY